MLAQWPQDPVMPQNDLPTLRAPVRSGDDVVGELQVVGLNDRISQQRLTLDAALLAQLLKAEDDLEDMTAELVESKDHLLALYDLTQSMRNNLGVVQTMRSLAQVTARIINAQVVFLLLNAPGYLEVVSHPVSLVDDSLLLDLFRQVQQRHREVIIDGRSSDYQLPNGVYNLCMLPIDLGGAVVAAVGMINGPGGFTSPDLKLLEAVAAHAGAQIENVLLHQETLVQAKLQTEMDLAKQAQTHLLPDHPPRVSGLDIYAETRPALHVGGDFYDFIYQAEKPFVFSLGDVAGKGMSAALLMAMTRTAIRTKATFMPSATPDMIMNRSSDDLFGDFAQMNKFATVFVGQYRPDSRELTYTNAGHAPVIYYPCGGTARLLEANGSAIGVLHRQPYTRDTLQMNPGDLLIIATDGFSEARTAQREMFGFERLLELTDMLSGHSARKVAELWFEAIAEFEAGYTQDDDQTLMVIKVQSDT
jgi:sigma-B regulation protein RsbU (phosphoserine phosphatase)